MKKILSLCIIMLFVFSPTVTLADTALELNAPSAILMEASTGQILYEKNSHEKLPPASVTKVMTMLLVAEAIDSDKIKLDDMVTCSEYAASMGGSQVYLEPGEQMSVRDMLKAVAVASGNDAACALAEHIAGSNEGFIALMNERAAQLGMKNTNFINSNGLDDPNHYTSAYDIALMSKELINHPLIFEFTTIWMDSLRGGEFGLVNTNKLIRFYEGATGLKTGSTGLAKYCLSATAKRNNMGLIAVVMAAPTSQKRFADASKLLDYGFANYAIANSLVTPEELTPIKVQKGMTDTVETTIDDKYNLLVSKAKLSKIEKKMTFAENVSAPIKAGEKLGEVEFFIDGEKIGATDIIAKTDVGKINAVQMFVKMTKHFLLGK